MTDRYTPVVGQRYADLDPRAVGRVVEVVALIEERDFGGRAFVRYLKVRCIANREGALRSSVGKETRIHVSRLREAHNGYRLLEETE